MHLKTELKSKIARCIYHTLETVGQRLSVSNAGGKKRDEPKIKMAAEWGEGGKWRGWVANKENKGNYRTETQKSTDETLYKCNVSFKRCND